MIWRFAFLPLAVAALAGTSPAQALLAPAETEAPAESPAPIATEQDAGADAAIASRIAGIFGELPAFAHVEVTVREGVVSLSGTVSGSENSARAEAIAGRVSGVVTVENRLVRDLSVDESLDRVGGLTDRLGEFWRSLPAIGLALLVGLLIGGLGYLLAGLTGVWNRLAANPFLAELIASAIRFVFVIGGLVVALDMLGAGTLLGAVLGGAGVVGIALGFAMRDTVENYVASLMLSLRQPFRSNDWVVIENYEGRVIRLTSRATILMTLDGNHLRIPNSTVFKAVILNYTRNPQRRFDFELGIDAADDPNAARQLGVETLRGLDFVLAEPEPQARLSRVGDSNIVLQFLAWIDQTGTDFNKARSQAIPAVKNALEQAGFALPEPIYRLRFDQGMSLPGTIAAGRSAAEPPRTARPYPVPAERAEDTEPEQVIERMVEEERAADPQAPDLLDPRRPVE